MGGRELLLVGVILGTGDSAIDTELKKLHGTWKVVSAEVNGVNIAPTPFAKTAVLITGSRITFKDGDKAYDEIDCDLD
jgi:uncharacterized protein (TIGR03067 family)